MIRPRRTASWTALVVALCACCRGQGTKSIVLGGSTAASASLPESAPYNWLPQFRVEFRITNLQVSPNQQEIFSVANNIWCGILPNSSILQLVDYFEAGSPSLALDLTGRTDVLIRYERSARGNAQVELWNADGTGYSVTNSYPVAAAHDFSGTLNVGSLDGRNYLRGQLAYFRGYSSATPVGAARPSNLAGGDLFDYEFEGSFQDSGPNNINLSISGPAVYASTPFEVYLPDDFTAAAGVQVVIDASGSGATAYTWTQTAGPTDCLLASTSSSALVLTNCLSFGQRSFSLNAISAAGQSGVASVNVGVVPTNRQGVVLLDDPAVNFLLGSMLRFGVAQSATYDNVEAQMADYWYGDPDRHRGNVRCQAEQNGCGWSASDVETTNYYDAVLVLYQMYYRTGLTKYSQEARALASFFWANFWVNGTPPGGCASNFIAPRDASAAGMILYARDQAPQNFGCIQDYVDWEFNDYLEQRDATQMYTVPYYGIRESGYSFYYGTLLATAHPDAGIRAQWMTRLKNELTSYVQAFQCSDSSRTEACNFDAFAAAGTVAVQNGSSEVAGAGSSFTTQYSAGGRFWINDPMSGWMEWTVLSVADDTHMRLTQSYNGSSGSGYQHAYLSPAKHPGAWKWADSLLGGWAEQAWHVGILMEGVINYDILSGGSAQARSILLNWLKEVDVSELMTGTCTDAAIQGNYVYYAAFAAFFPPDRRSTCSVNDLSNNVTWSRAQNNTVAHAYGYAYMITLDHSYLASGDTLFGADYGLNAGPYSDGYAGLFGTIGNGGKQFGQSFRSSIHYPAYRAEALSTRILKPGDPATGTSEATSFSRLQ